MTSLSSPQAASPQAASPLGRFTQFPREVRLRIYAFVFMGCQSTFWLDGKFGNRYIKTSRGRRRKVYLRYGRYCYEHFGGGFGFLATSSMFKDEAWAIYWQWTVLKVSNNAFPKNASCELQKVCAYLPAAVKENLCHLRNTRLPVQHKIRPTEDDTNWTPTLLMQFPKLKSCAFFGKPPLAGGLKKDYILRVPDSQEVSQHYDGVGPFHVHGGESPAAFIERRIGVTRKDCRVMILSKASGEVPTVHSPGYKPRNQYFNYTTGMVYQTTIHPEDEDGFEKILGEKEGAEWRRCYHDRRRR